jgi:geranylgeranyl pyrophosphate synthase
MTLPVILALRREPDLARDVAAVRGDGHRVEALCDRLAAHRGVAEARERALGFVAAARAAIDGPLDGADADALLEIADGVVDRFA